MVKGEFCGKNLLTAPTHKMTLFLWFLFSQTQFLPSLCSHSPADHEAKVSLSVLSLPAAQIPLHCQRAQIPGP